MTLTVETDNRDSAEHHAYNFMSSGISYLSYHHDVGLDITAYQIVEVATGIESYSVNLLGRERPLKLDIEARSDTPFRAVLSMYRDGLVSFSPLFQALCFYKVIEGCSRLREERHRMSRLSGIESPRYFEVIPENPSSIPGINLNDVSRFEPFTGWKFGRVRQELEHTVRDAVAHLDLSVRSQKFASSDKYDDLTVCRMAVPVLRYMARVMIENELSDNFIQR